LNLVIEIKSFLLEVERHKINNYAIPTKLCSLLRTFQIRKKIKGGWLNPNHLLFFVKIFAVAESSILPAPSKSSKPEI